LGTFYGDENYMYKEIWQNIYKSICSITFLKDDDRIASGTGFKVNNRLVTNYHVIQVPIATHVQLRFVKEDGNTDYISKKISLSEFLTKQVDSMPVDNWDYAIFDLDWPEFNTIPSLNLCVGDDFHIGQSVVLFGYQFGQPNLSIHSGILASRFVNDGVKYLQLDASVNQGNSGGPLINPNTSEVIGIVTRKNTGLTGQFDELLKSFDYNIQALERASKGGRIQMFGIDPIEGMKISQTQMAKISIEIRRSANVGIGYAYELEKVRQGINR
jgi:V8-like Glu-specific endopeptidase